MDSDLFSLRDRVALVTGGNGGLGRAMALGLVQAGARVAVTGRNREKNARIALELGDRGAAFDMDVTVEAEVENTVGSVIERFGRLDVLVNNAGYARVGKLLELSLEEWEEIIGVNLTGSFLCAKHAVRWMIHRGAGGKIINIGSIYSLFGTPDFSSYGAAKTGVVGLTRALAVELAPHNIQVNALLPGWFNTDRTARVQERSLGEQIRSKTPAQRWGEPEDLVAAAIFFASRSSAFVTGTALPVDGGYSVSERFGQPPSANQPRGYRRGVAPRSRARALGARASCRCVA